MYKFIVGKTIKRKIYKGEDLLGNKIYEKQIIPKGTYVELIPIGFLHTVDAFPLPDSSEEDLSDLYMQLEAIFVKKDASMQFEDKTITYDSSLSDNADILHIDFLDYTEIPAFIKFFKLKVIKKTFKAICLQSNTLHSY